jgi:hypothetical protein
MHPSGLASLKKSALPLIENLYIRPAELARMQKPTERPKGTYLLLRSLRRPGRARRTGRPRVIRRCPGSSWNDEPACVPR